MNKSMAFSNALGIINYLCTMHPDWLSAFTNYGCCYEITAQVPENHERVKEELRVLGVALLEGTEIETYYNRNIKRWVISIHWRRLS